MSAAHQLNAAMTTEEMESTMMICSQESETLPKRPGLIHLGELNQMSCNIYYK